MRDSTNSLPWARCEAAGRARRPPRPPSLPRDAPVVSETREIREQTPQLPGGAASAASDPAIKTKGPQLHRPGGALAPGTGGAAGGLMMEVCPLPPCPGRMSEMGRFHDPLWGKLFLPPRAECCSPRGQATSKSLPDAHELCAAPGGGGGKGATPTRVRGPLQSHAWQHGGGTGPPSRGVCAERRGARLQPVPALGAEIEM